MAHIKSRKDNRALPPHLNHCSAAALALLALPGALYAQTVAPAPDATASQPAAQQAAEPTLPEVKVKAKVAVENTYKADTSSLPKFTQPLVDTPQTITVIKKEILLQQGATTLS